MTYQLRKKPRQRVAPYILAGLMLMGVTGSYAQATRQADSQSGKAAVAVAASPSYGQRRAEIALAEYHKGVAETTPGCNCGPRIDMYTQGSAHQWCSMFASWVAMQAGTPVQNAKTGSWKIPKSRDFAAYLEHHGTWYSRQEIMRTGVKPKVGDFVVYWRGQQDGTLGHIEIVTDPNNDNDTVSMVGGNIGHKVYVRNIAYAQQDKLLGFGRPEK